MPHPVCRDAQAERTEIGEAFHGAIDFSEMRRRGIDPARLIDFSTNVNPFGPSPLVREAVCRAVLDRYPDRECWQLRETISQREGVAVDRILVGSGSSELLQSLTQAFLRANDEVLIIGPTYSEYARASRLAGALVSECRATPDSGFAIPIDIIEAALRKQSPKIAFLCNPNNPTGQVVPRELILAWGASSPSTLFVIDESYIDFLGPEMEVSAVPAVSPNLIVLKSLTKSHAIAGLRLGYAIAAPDVIQALRRRRIPWNVSAPAQSAGVAAMGDQLHLERCMTRLQRAKRELIEGLLADGCEPVPSAANFFLLRLRDAAAVREHLLSHDVLVRDCRSFGIPEYIRIGARTRAENRELMSRLSTMRC